MYVLVYVYGAEVTVVPAETAELASVMMHADMEEKKKEYEKKGYAITKEYRDNNFGRFKATEQEFGHSAHPQWHIKELKMQ